MKRNLSLALCFAILLSIINISPAMAKKKYDFLWTYHNGIAQFEKSKKIGLMNEAGEIILPAEYDEINPCFQNGYTWVIKKGLYGLIDDKGNVMIKPQYKYLDQVSSGLAAAQDAKTGLYGYVDVNGNWVVEPKYYLTQPFYGEIGVAYDGEENTIDIAGGRKAIAQHALVFNRKGEIINDLGMVHWIGSHSGEVYDGSRDRDDIDYPNFARGDAFAYDLDIFDYETMAGTGFLNEDGQVVDCSKLGVDPHTITSGMYHFHDGRLLVMKQVGEQVLYGYIDRNGSMVIEPQYLNALSFYQGKAYVTEKEDWKACRDNSNYHFIDAFGNDCGKNGVLGNQNYNISSRVTHLPITETDKYKQADCYWSEWLPIDEDVYIFDKYTADGSPYTKSKVLGGDDTQVLSAYVNVNTKEIIYENTFDYARTDFGCDLYKVMDRKMNIGYIDKDGMLISGLKKKGQ